MKFIVTGANGYIGSRVVKLLQQRGHTVFGLTRSKPRNSAITWVPYDLAHSANRTSELLIDIDGIIHLAATTGAIKEFDEYPDIQAARRLITLAKKTNIKFVFISSQTARADAPTNYGRIKWLIEQEVISAGGLAIRPGQFYGGKLQGLFGTMTRMVKRMPVLPRFIPHLPIRPIHVDDLAEAIVNILEGTTIVTGIMFLGAPVPVTFTRFLEAIALERVRRRRVFIPLPLHRSLMS